MSCLWSETGTQTRTAPTMSPEDIGALVCNIDQAQVVRTGKVVPFLEKFFSPDFVLHMAGDPKVYSRADYADLLNAFHTAFPDSKSDIHDVIIEGDRVAVFETLRYTHTGDFVGLPPTGNKVEYQQMSFWRVADGLVQEIWLVADTRTVWGQLMAPVPE